GEAGAWGRWGAGGGRGRGAGSRRRPAGGVARTAWRRAGAQVRPQRRQPQTALLAGSDAWGNSGRGRARPRAERALPQVQSRTGAFRPLSVMPALVAGIHVFLATKQDVDGRDNRLAKRRRLRRLCPAMTW